MQDHRVSTCYRVPALLRSLPEFPICYQIKEVCIPCCLIRQQVNRSSVSSTLDPRAPRRSPTYAPRLRIVLSPPARTLYHCIRRLYRRCMVDWMIAFSKLFIRLSALIACAARNMCVCLVVSGVSAYLRALRDLHESD